MDSVISDSLVISLMNIHWMSDKCRVVALDVGNIETHNIEMRDHQEAHSFSGEPIHQLL